LQLAGKEVEDVSEGTGLSFIQLCVTAVGAGYHGEFLVLHIKDFSKGSACCPDHIGFETCAAAFGALVLDFLVHNWCFRFIPRNYNILNSIKIVS